MPRPLYPRERPGTHCTARLVGLGAGLDGQGKLTPTGNRSPVLPAHSKQRLCYPGRLGINGRIILLEVLNEKYVNAWNELMWPRMESCGELF
jgi:hypothetical protein